MHHYASWLKSMLLITLLTFFFIGFYSAQAMEEVDTRNRSRTTSFPSKVQILTQEKLDDRMKKVTVDNVNDLVTDVGTCLHLAAFLGDIDSVNFLLKKGPDVNAANKGGSTPLHCAAYSGDYRVIQALLDQGADRTKRNGKNKTPFDIATAKYAQELLSF